MGTPSFEAAHLQRTFRQDHLYLILYLDQEYAGERQNQNTVVNPRHGKKFGGTGFGDTVVNDWPIYDGPDLSKASMVARAQGYHIQTGKDERGKWFLSCCIVFLDDSWYKLFYTSSALGKLARYFNILIEYYCMGQATRVPLLQ